MLIVCALGTATLLWSAHREPSMAQNESAKSLAERSAIVVRGTVLRVNASEEPLQAASANTAVVHVLSMLAGAEITGDQTGRNVTVILSRPSALKVGAEALFFGNPRFIGKSLTIVDEGEIPSPNAGAGSKDLELGLQARRDQPVRERLATASLVFRGKVESERPLVVTDQTSRLRVPPSEHDPEWHVAQVRIITPLRGGNKEALVMVIFPASRDIMWFNSPKLKPGLEGVFITHKPEKDQELLLRATGVTAFMEKQPAELVTHPFDFLPASEEGRVRGLLTSTH
jgi:hypothetical protein